MPRGEAFTIAAIAAGALIARWALRSLDAAIDHFCDAGELAADHGKDRGGDRKGAIDRLGTLTHHISHPVIARQERST